MKELERSQRSVDPLVYVILLNWNGWKDTVLCLESLFRVRYSNFRVVVCDNASTDDSVAKIQDWAAGSLHAETIDSALSHVMAPPLAKPISISTYSRLQAEESDVVSNSLIIISTGGNFGFAGGNNVGIRYALRDEATNYIWLLNNDTVVEADSLIALVNTAQQDSRLGMTGSVLRFFHAPAKVQAYGGAEFNTRRAIGKHIGEREDFRVLTPKETSEISRRMAYVVGASMLLTRKFVVDVGLMREDYFLYFEELDWAERARRRDSPYLLGFASESIVFHKAGASAGSSARSLFSLKYFCRNQLLFMYRFYPQFALLARVNLVWEAVKSLVKGKVSEARLIFGIAVSRISS